jgi:hypothetical protein
MFWQIIFILVLLIPIMAIVLDSQLGRALAGRLERRSLSDPDDVVAKRIAYLEGELERLSGDVSRLDEESQFLHKLLAERPPTEALPPGESED